MTLVAHTDNQLKNWPSRLESQCRNDQKVERLCDETFQSYQVFGDSAKGKITGGASPNVLMVIDRFEDRFLRRINLARAKKGLTVLVGIRGNGSGAGIQRNTNG